MKTGFYWNPIFLRHDTGNHPEHAGRLEAVVAGLNAAPLGDRVTWRNSRAASVEEIALIHDPDYVRYVEEMVASGRPYIDTPDCAVSPETYTVALHATGALLDAVVEVHERRLDNAFVACRPPGHHAEHHQAYGFCFFNNIAIAAELLIRKLGLERVLIFDFDVHHGNGTQHAFEARRDVFYCSIHQHPATLFPGTGFAEERGTGDGAGYTLNAPMRPYSTDADYLRVFQQLLLPQFDAYRPQFVLLSAGFDAHRDDPLAQINLTQDAFDAMLEGMKALAFRHCGGRIVSVLEGGYNLQRLTECVISHVDGLQADPD
jgi:acetoin utilization deacetylase AcuC-like enzyme